ncbi:hypothetical protein HY419_02130 [candidate division WWE3 bacterium]|nr:hypothetical protein [candidate division WWE3 bacterium]
MSKKILKGTFAEKCIGCELCVLAAQRMLGKVGLGSSRIRVLRNSSGFSIHLDPSVNELDVKKIAEICPKGCYTVEDVSEGDLLDFVSDEDDKSEK